MIYTRGKNNCNRYSDLVVAIKNIKIHSESAFSLHSSLHICGTKSIECNKSTTATKFDLVITHTFRKKKQFHNQRINSQQRQNYMTFETQWAARCAALNFKKLTCRKKRIITSIDKCRTCVS